MSIVDQFQNARMAQLEGQLEQADGATTDVLGALSQQLKKLQQEVARQNAALTVLTQVLIERGAVDGGVLKQRFDQAMVAAQAAANTIVCMRCRKQVDRSATQITDQGAVCGACYQALMSDE